MSDYNIINVDKSNTISVVIRTIGRPTLCDAIKSAQSEFKNVIVVADAVDLDFKNLPSDVLYLKTGMKHDKYGSAALNMGAYACSTPYFCLLDDDDCFIEGAGEYMVDKVLSDWYTDIWIPGIKFSDGKQLCMSPQKGVVVGNVAVPTYKTRVLFLLPFGKGLANNNIHCIDYNHLSILNKWGVKIRWYEKLLYNIRPKLQGNNGRGVL